MKRNLAGSSVAIVVIGILSKIMGMVRTSLIARSFGQSMATDAYYAAYKGAMLAMVLINVTVNSVLIPLMAKAKEERGIEGKYRFFNNFTTVAGLLNILLAGLTALFAPYLAGFLVAGGSEELLELTTKLIRIMSPTVIFIGYVYAFGTYQQSVLRFAPFAAIGIVNNLAFFAYLIPAGARADIVHLAYITVIGSVLQLIFILLFFRKEPIRLRPRFDLRDPYLKDYVILAIPLFMASGFNQVNHFVTNFIASYLEEGVITTIDNSYRLFSAILQLVATTIATVVYPTLSEAFMKKDHETRKRVVDNGFEVMLLILIPATVALMIFADPIVQIVYERGKFTAYDTYLTKTAFTLFAVGLTGHGLKQYLSRVFYSGQDTFRPMIIQGATVLFNIVAAFVLVRLIGFRGLPLSQSLAGIASALLLLVLLAKSSAGIRLKNYFVIFLKILAASLVMGVFVRFLYGFLSGGQDLSNLKALICLIICAVAGSAVYFALCRLFRLRSLMELRGMIKRKLEKK